MDNASQRDCPLCRSGGAGLRHEEHGRQYYACTHCGLLFVPPEFHLTPAAERARYQTHRNDPGEAGYRTYLGQLTDCLSPRLRPGAVGLDYGSGPGPALSVMMAEMGFRCRNYDPYFCPDEDALMGRYDFITCTETAEHFRNPHKEFSRMTGLLEPGGLLGVLTKMPGEGMPLSGWSYLRDETHIAVYSSQSMHYIARKFGLKADLPAKNVVIFIKGNL